MLLARAKQIDAGFDAQAVTAMIVALDQFTDDEIPVPDGTSAARTASVLRDLAIRTGSVSRVSPDPDRSMKLQGQKM